ncbi:MAG: Hsp70 family protein [Candidatus Omnitrophota bacterium]
MSENTLSHNLKPFIAGEFPIDPRRCALGWDLGNSETKIVIAHMPPMDQPIFRLLHFNGIPFIPSKAALDRDNQLRLGSEAENLVYLGEGAIYSIGKDLLKSFDAPCLYWKNQPLKPADLIEKFAAFMIQQATASLGFPAQELDSFISCPANFDSQQRQLWKEAIERAGIRLIGMENEPNQAVRSLIGSLPVKGYVSILDIGGGTTDLSIGEISPERQRFSILGSGACNLAGNNLTQILVEIVQDKALDGQPLTDPALRSQLYQSCVAAKHALTYQPDTVVPVADGKQFQACRITGAELEERSRPLLQRIGDAYQEILAQSGLARNQIPTQLLTGGSTLTPFIRNYVQREFPDAAIYLSSHPQFDVCLGNAMSALEQTVRTGKVPPSLHYIPPVEVQNITLHDICVAICPDASKPRELINDGLIPRGTLIPTEVLAGEYAPVYPQQTSARIVVSKGEPETPFTPDQELGWVRIPLKPQSGDRVVQVRVEMQVDCSSIVHIKARDLFTGDEKQLDLSVGIREKS